MKLTLNMMSLKLSALLFLALIANGCGNHHPGSDFITSTMALKQAQDYWLNHGRPADFQPGQYLGLTNEFFVYTNTIKTSNAVFHCRFGASTPILPPGVLAITDDRQMIFICTNGKVTTSPDKYGVDP